MTDGLSALRSYRVPWAGLLKKVFAIDVLACPECGGCLELMAFISDTAVAARILEHLGLDATGPPLARAEVPKHDVVDPVYSE